MSAKGRHDQAGDRRFSLPVPPRTLSANREKRAHKLSGRLAARTARGPCRRRPGQVGRASTARTDAETRLLRSDRKSGSASTAGATEPSRKSAARPRKRNALDVRNVSTGGRSRREAQSQANARWERLYEETLDATGSRWGLCQWEDEDANGDYLGRRCTRRTAGVYCWRHNRQLERESERRRREKERASTSFPTPTIQKE
jgi:hypothetical protein